MQQSNDLSFSADERCAILALADAMQADVHFDRPEPHPDLPYVHQLGEFAQIVVKPTEDDSEPAAFTIQTTGDPLRRYVRLGHTGHPQATGKTLSEALWSLELAHGFIA